MLKAHYKLLSLSLIVTVVTIFLWYSTVYSLDPKSFSKPIAKLSAENSYLTDRLNNNTSNEESIETKATIKIQNFPVMISSFSDYKTLPNFQTEQFFSSVYSFKNKNKVKSLIFSSKIAPQKISPQTKPQVINTNLILKSISLKAKTNIIRISNIPVNRGHLSSQYGIRKDPFHGSRRMHKGIDIAAPYGSPVKPMGKGIVIYSGNKIGFGNTVEIKHGNTVITRYAHLKRFLVDVGQQVSTKDTIGLVGSTGRSTGPHLHLEVLFNGKQADPQKFLANHFGSRPNSYQLVKSETENVKEKVIVSAISEKPPQTSDFLQVSYQDYVNSMDGLFGFTAPASFSK